MTILINWLLVLYVNFPARNLCHSLQTFEQSTMHIILKKRRRRKTRKIRNNSIEMLLRNNTYSKLYAVEHYDAFFVTPAIHCQHTLQSASNTICHSIGDAYARAYADVRALRWRCFRSVKPARLSLRACDIMLGDNKCAWHLIYIYLQNCLRFDVSWHFYLRKV